LLFCSTLSFLSIEVASALGIFSFRLPLFCFVFFYVSRTRIFVFPPSDSRFSAFSLRLCSAPSKFLLVPPNPQGLLSSSTQVSMLPFPLSLLPVLPSLFSKFSICLLPPISAFDIFPVLLFLPNSHPQDDLTVVRCCCPSCVPLLYSPSVSSERNILLALQSRREAFLNFLRLRDLFSFYSILFVSCPLFRQHVISFSKGWFPPFLLIFSLQFLLQSDLVQLKFHPFIPEVSSRSFPPWPSPPFPISLAAFLSPIFYLWGFFLLFFFSLGTVPPTKLEAVPTLSIITGFFMLFRCCLVIS